MQNQGNLLVIRNDRLGDAILALPTIPLLQRKFPDARIFFWSSPGIATIIKCVEGIDDVFVSDDNGEPDITTELKQANIDTAFCLRPTFHNAITLKRAGISIRIGTSRRWYSFLFTGRVHLPRSGVNRHETDFNIDLIATLGEGKTRKFPKIIIPDEASQKISELFSNNAINDDSRIIVIHPGSGGSARNWPPEYFKQLADKIAELDDVKILISGTPQEMRLCEFVAGNRHINLCGKTNLLELAALLKKTTLLISNSTGPLHLANALGSKVLGIYPPVKNCLPLRWGPYGNLNRTITPELPLCFECHPGKISSCYCMEELSISTVFYKSLEIISEE